MKAFIAGIAIWLLSVNIAAAAPGNQFGLDCTGDQIDGVKQTTTPFHARMSVDLVHKTLCFLPACDSLYQLGPVTDQQINLLYNPISSNYLVATVDRKTGAYQLVMQSHRANLRVGATCTYADFTPFPLGAKPAYTPLPKPGDRVVTSPPLPLP